MTEQLILRIIELLFKKILGDLMILWLMFLKNLCSVEIQNEIYVHMMPGICFKIIQGEEGIKMKQTGHELIINKAG